MATCIINNKEYEIELANTPFTAQWLEHNNNKVLPVKVGYDTDTHTELSTLLNKHRNFFKKLKLTTLSEVQDDDLWNQQTLNDIHLEIVSFQKNHKTGTDLANRNTNYEWDYIHDYLHALETDIRHNTATFGHGEKSLGHDSKTLTQNWSWDPLMTANEFYESSSFDRYHFNVPFTELGRHPYEAFIYSPNTYHQEGSMIGQVGQNVEVQLVKTYPSPEKGYQEWCDQNELPPAGTHFPLANFVKQDDAKNIIDADSIVIKHN